MSEIDKVVCRCHGVRPSGERGYFYVTPQLFPRIKGNPLNLPKSQYICAVTKEPCEVRDEEEVKE